MKNKIFINNKLIKKIEKIGKFKKFIFEDSFMLKKDFKNFEIECNVCNTKTKLNCLTKKHLDFKYLCISCGKKGELNHFYGKKHSEKSIRQMKEIKLGMYDKEKNPFYGKKHSEETKSKISKNLKNHFLFNLNPFYGKKHSEETKLKLSTIHKFTYSLKTNEEKEEISRKISNSLKIFQNNNVLYTHYIRRKAALKSIISQKNYKINKIETIVQNKIKEMELDFKYSVIIGYNQYDFGNKKHKILIEVQGDYWHSNPNLYSEKDLNETQKNKKKRDEEKKLFAEKNGFELYYIWESEIYNNEYILILNKIKDKIKCLN